MAKHRTIKDYTDRELLNTPVAKELYKRNYKIIHRSIFQVLIKSKKKRNIHKQRGIDYDKFE